MTRVFFLGRSFLALFISLGLISFSFGSPSLGMAAEKKTKASAKPGQAKSAKPGAAESGAGAAGSAGVFISAGVYKKTIGDLEIYALSDNRGRLEFSVLLGLTRDQIRAMVGQNSEMDNSSLTSYINAFLVKSPVGLFLVDTGLGNGDTLVKGIKEAGFSPEDVTDVLLTHFHRDHIDGLLSGGKSLFPKATVWASKNEDRYWIKDNQNNRGQSAETKIFPYRRDGRYKLFEPGQAIRPGVETIELYGHTPGHVGYLFTSGRGRDILFWGDIVHAYLIQFQSPQTAVTYDVDSTVAAETRSKILKTSAERDYWVAGAHLPFPGLGRVKARSSGQGYDWIQER
ncbi:MAG: MBL fold metallo-hydrolase [Deltaproteobacteria bacterium]|jgi:glyoxylase-like metal-dependent hydrolase (beta-lactamase superfamily II)|nr:MBL fold metallo-hydrolase [Deltaproteobacteria bacterium]